jgi:hypothetical protein
MTARGRCEYSVNGGYLVSAAYFDEYSGPIDAVESGSNRFDQLPRERGGGDALVPWLSSTFVALSAGGFSCRVYSNTRDSLVRPRSMKLGS